jgi:hypothetical protein
VKRHRGMRRFTYGSESVRAGEGFDVLAGTRPPEVALDRALALRAAAVRGIRRRGLYLVDLVLAIHRLRRAAAALRTAGPGGTPVERTNLDHLGAALDLELALLLCLRGSYINRAETVYRDLIDLHGTDDASRDAAAGLPANVRDQGNATALAFALAMPLLVDYLRAALPDLHRCRHGRLSATGDCAVPACPTPA